MSLTWNFHLLIAVVTCIVAVVSYTAIPHYHVHSRRVTRGTRITTRQKKTPLILPVSINHNNVVAEALSNKSPQKKSSNKKSKKNSATKARNYFVQLNKEISGCETAADVIDLLATSAPDALKKTAGGGVVNSINFATAIHRIGRYLSFNNQDRVATLSDPKFALFLCSFAEAFAGVDYTQPLSSLLNEGPREATSSTRLTFGIRERTNLVWALAKLRLVPPVKSVPLMTTCNGNSMESRRHQQEQKTSQGLLHRDLADTSVRLRKEVLASQKTQDKTWITTLSLLSAQLIDTVANLMVEEERESTYHVQEIVNLLWAFAAVQRPSVAVFDQIGSILLRELDQRGNTSFVGEMIPKPQEFSNAIWAMATASYTGDCQRKLIELIAWYLESYPNWISTFKPQEVSNTAWGIATLLSLRRQAGEANTGSLEEEKEDLAAVTIFRSIASTLTERCDAFKSQEISNTIWAFGTLGFGSLTDKRNINDFIVLISDNHEQDVALVNQALQAVSDNVSGRLKAFKEQELNNLAHGCGRLGRCEPTLFVGIAYEFGRRQGRISGQDIGTTLWSFATTKYFDKASFEYVLSRLRLDAVARWKPQEISNMAWALGTAAIAPKYPKAFDVSLIPPSERVSFEKASQDPITLAFAAVGKEILTRPEEFKTQELKDSLWGLSKAGIRHPLVFRRIAEFLVGREKDIVPVGKLHTGVGMDSFSSQEIANLCWAYAKQGQLACENSEALNGRMAVYCASAVDIGETLLKRFIYCAAETNLANYGDFSRFSTTDLSNTLWSLATLGCRHSRFFEVCENQILSRCQRYLSGQERSPMTTFRGQEICNAVWALATLNCITPHLLDTVGPYIQELCTDSDGKVSIRSIAAYLHRIELGNLAWSCTVAGHYPPDLIHLLMKGLVGVGGDESVPRGQSMTEYLDDVYGEKGGLSEHSIMTLLYLHYGMQLDGAVIEGAKLPPNFPIGWGDSAPMFVGHNYGELLEDETGKSLTLTTSKVQQQVSAAFTRVGFKHVEEFMVPNTHEDDTTMRSIDFLSLDIADPSCKIGIEVDGPSHFYHNLDQWSPQDPPNGQVRVSGRKVEYDFDWNAQRNNPNGSTCLKDRLLTKLGWKIIHIPFWEWYPMRGDQQQEDEYCRKLLDQL